MKKCPRVLWSILRFYDRIDPKNFNFGPVIFSKMVIFAKRRLFNEKRILGYLGLVGTITSLSQLTP